MDIDEVCALIVCSDMNAELVDAFIEAVLDSADEWEKFVDEDHAPLNLRSWLARAISDFIRKQA